MDATIIQTRLAKRQEITDLKICLADQLSEIETVIEKMVETYSTTSTIPNDYFNSLNTHSEPFATYKQKLHLISKPDLRKRFRNFYKDLDKKINDSLNTVGSLNPASTNTQQNVINDFKTIALESTQLRGMVEEFKYRAFYLF